METISLLLISIFSTIITAAINAQQTESNNQRNLENSKELIQYQNEVADENAQKANERDEEMYLKYFSPQAKVQQYQQAGLNPGLMYGGGGTGGQSIISNMAATPSATLPTMQAPQLPIGSLIQEFKTAMEAKATKDENKRENEKQNYVIEELWSKIQESYKNQDFTNVKTAQEQINNGILQLELNLKSATAQEQADTVKENLNLIKIQIEKYNKEVESLNIDLKYKDTLKQYEVQEFEKGIQKITAEIAKTWKEINWGNIQAQYTSQLSQMTADEIGRKRQQFEQEKRKWDNEYNYSVTQLQRAQEELTKASNENKAFWIDKVIDWSSKVARCVTEAFEAASKIMFVGKM